jgi:transglutaminase-like putative cysteine protease
VNQRRHVTLVAAGATLLAAMPLSTVFATWSWLIDAVLVVGAIAGVGLLVRTLRTAVWVPTVAMAVTYLFVLSWIFHSGHELAGLIPTTKTFDHFNTLLLNAGTDMRDLGVPVEDRDGLLFLSTLGIGGVAILIDLFAVVLRHPALAGLPMLAIYSVPVAVHQDSVSFVPFAAGAAGFLWLLVTDNVDRIRRFGRRFTGDGRDVDVWEPSPLAAAGRRLALVGVLAAVALPLIVPGSNTGLLDKFGSAGGSGGDGVGGGGGTGSSVNLYAMLSGQLNTNRTFDMVKVQTNDPSPYYLRFGVADEVTSAGFRNRSPSGGQSVSAGLPTPPIGPGTGITGHAYHAQVQVMALDMRALPVYLQPTKVNKVDSSWLYDRTNQVVYSRRGNARDKQYTFDYVHLEYSPQALNTAKPLDANNPIQRQYTAVSKIPEVESKLAPIIAGKTTPYDKVRAIHSYFSTANGFRYSLQTRSGTSGSAIVDFLNNKQGFCEQYSAAMAWLVRAAGIPARVAFGFSRGTNRNGETWTLTNRNLHAWTEVYFDQYGWVPFDPTPAAFVAGVDSAWAPDPNRLQTQPGGNSGTDDIQRPGGANSSASAAPGNGPHNEPVGPGGTGASPTTPLTQWPFWTLLGVIAVLFLLSMPAIWRHLLRRRRWPDRLAGAPPAVAVAPGSREVVVTTDGAIDLARRRAHAAWDELVDTMIDYRLPVDLAVTPRATAERLVKESALDEYATIGARLLGHAEERARYAREPLQTEDLSGSLRAVRDAIIHRVSWRTRLRAALLPASVVGRWQIAFGEVSTRATDAITRRRDRIVRTLSPRRLLPGTRH